MKPTQISKTRYNTPHTTQNSKLQAQAGKRILMLHIWNYIFVTGTSIRPTELHNQLLGQQLSSNVWRVSDFQLNFCVEERLLLVETALLVASMSTIELPPTEQVQTNA